MPPLLLPVIELTSHRRATNVGKGIGYVQFKDKAAVGLALKLSKSELEGRKIRVERCKDTEAKPKQVRSPLEALSICLY